MVGLVCTSQQFCPCNEADLSRILNLKIFRVEYSHDIGFLGEKFGPSVYGNLKYGKCDTIHVYESN